MQSFSSFINAFFKKKSPEQPEDLAAKPKTRVVPFGRKSLNQYYVCQFFYKGRWINFTENFTIGDLSLWADDQPKLFRHFENAVNFCKQWQTTQQILDHRAALDKEFAEKKENLLKKIDKQQKTWESES